MTIPPPPPGENLLSLEDKNEVSINIGYFGSGRKIKLYAHFKENDKVPDLTTRGDIIEYLDQQDGPGPIPLVIGADYEVAYKDTGKNPWQDLLDAIDFACSRELKTVALDISQTTLSTTDGVFDPTQVPGTGDTPPVPYNTGEPYIVELVLPEAATTINARGFGQNDNNKVKIAFNSLTKVSGAKVETIGAAAFLNCAALETADFPAAETIEAAAFELTALTEADFPAATSIDMQAFNECTALKTANFRAVVDIGLQAFGDCTTLETANFPAVETIQTYAFYHCTALTSLTLPKDPPGLEDGVFAYTYDTANESTLYIHVGSENAAKEYESGEFHSAVANQDPDQVDKYGPNHKQIDITP